MPASSVRGKYAETAWKRAKEAVSKQYGGEVPKGSDRYYELVMHIYKSICASPKHNCTPTIKTHPSSRKRAESMKELLSRLEEEPGQVDEAEAARLAEEKELTEMMGFDHTQSDLYHEVLSTVGYGDVKNPESVVKAATKKIYEVRMTTLRNNLDLVGKAATGKLHERNKMRAAERR